MTTSRSRLALHKIDDFAAFCATEGYTRVPTVGFYEVLRMTKPGFHTLIAHSRSGAKEHATLHGTSTRMFNKWLDKRRTQPTTKAADAAGE